MGVHDGRLRLGRGRRRGRGCGREGVLAPHTGRLGRLAVVDSPAVKPVEKLSQCILGFKYGLYAAFSGIKSRYKRSVRIKVTHSLRAVALW